jgi:putative ATPase
MEDLFSTAQPTSDQSLARPLAERARPQKLEDFFGQTEVLGKGQPLDALIRGQRAFNVILWGPPGCGKTTFARLVATKTKSQFVSLSAIHVGVKDLKEEGEWVRTCFSHFGEHTILFLDEIHRLNKAQQDCLLLFIEWGDFTLIGATTENPSFELNSALMSRSQLVVFKQLGEKELSQVLDRGLEMLEPGLSWKALSHDTEEFDLKSQLVRLAAGDGRRALGLLEVTYSGFIARGRQAFDFEAFKVFFKNAPIRYDKKGEGHYDTISAFIKSVRGSDPDAALYYLARMLKGGEDPLFIARRLVILASEDVGNADPRALQVAVNVKDAVEFLGLPEAAISLAQGVTYLASSPKSNRSYAGLQKAQALVEAHPELETPLALRNAPTRLMKGLGYGEAYQYDHDSLGAIADQEFLPEKIAGEAIYEPSQRGFEKQIAAYLEWVAAQRKKG